eukprot:CAMPEP_0202916554 /NCGR_PEP_ID=MMETSP1392-20130828/68844_1 /ASSEMBLY_ACC=CAM_ASM_000868 /TAXON_ID=225041 /ORGANISM="Chlamydomonas chlamydogama, Strain SAG 11-48b" /LENGTH=98 /DNA_ID=CAMNT_0049609035 /DNA_START=74 /DNA_END=370 /DNA_ORIENTATION=-
MNAALDVYQRAHTPATCSLATSQSLTAQTSFQNLADATQFQALFGASMGNVVTWMQIPCGSTVGMAVQSTIHLYMCTPGGPNQFPVASLCCGVLGGRR